MIPARLPASEGRRLDTLARYEILDTSPERAFDDITMLVSQVCETPIALVSLVDKHRQWFKSRAGLVATDTPRDVSFCGHAILRDDIFIVEDALKDPRFLDNPLVLNHPNIRFYAGAPLKTPTGENIGTLCVIDRIPRKLTEAQKNSLVVLSRQVIAQIELRFALQNASLKVRSKALFLADISHELRTPMNAISSCATLLTNQIEDQKQRKMLGLISNASKGLISMIDETLNISEQGLYDVELKKISFDPRELVKGVVDILGVHALEMDRYIYNDTKESVPDSIMGDPTRARQLLYNLAGNALQLCSQTVTVSLDVKKTSHGDRLLMTVKDDSAGMTQKNQDKIFEQFAQTEKSNVVPEIATELGLSTCKTLRSAMKGSISVSSTLGVGTTISVELPFWRAQDTAVMEKPRVVFEFDSKMSENHPMRILIAEDSEVNQFIISTMLGKLGYTVDMVADGREAVDASLAGDYDLIFMDIRMPNMSGKEATQKIRLAAIRQPTIVAVTANAFDEDKSQALSAGMDGFITKPISLECLGNAIKSVQNSAADVQKLATKKINTFCQGEKK